LSRARITVVLLVALALVAPALPAGAGSFPGANGKIVYIAGDDVFTVDPDGTDVANLTQTEGLDAENVSASPDGKKIAFNVGSPTALDDAGLYVMNMNGSGFRDLLATRHDDFIAVGAPTWSPDGRRIAFEAYNQPAFKNELFVIDADGTDLRKLTNCDCVSSSYPTWSPVGPEIAFVPCCSQVVTTINANTGATAEVFAPESGYASNLTWSPDGTQIAYLQLRGQRVDLRVVTFENAAEAITLVDDKAITEDGSLDAGSPPAWFVPTSERATPGPSATDAGTTPGP
jgi:Tol biopolymer transport system component